MMNGLEKSDPAIVAGKPANKGARAPAEWVEPRAGTKGNTGQDRTRRTQSRCSVSPGLDRVRQAAQAGSKSRFTALLHHVDVALLEWAYFALKPQAAAGVDGLTWSDYGEKLQSNLQGLHARLHRGGYRPLPVRRSYIDKGGGARRPLGITAVEDKLVQRALVEVLNAIYEEDFLEMSYGFRPGRSAHDAMDTLCVNLCGWKVNWVLDADIRSYFDTIDQECLIGLLEQRIGDGRVIRLIRRWLRAGVLEDGLFSVSEQGTPQGAVISPLLANVYLHYTFDLWAEQWHKQKARGHMIAVRYADDLVVGFEHEADARLFWEDLRWQLEGYGLELHGLKTRLLEFGRKVATERKKQGLGKLQTFKFLGFVFICGRSRSGDFQLKRKSRSDRMRAKIKEIKEQLRKRMHQPVAEQGRWLRQVVQGHNAYFAVPTNLRAIATFRHHVANLWRRTLMRRSQRKRVTWKRMDRLLARWLPTPKILHLWPSKRYAVNSTRGGSRMP
jgi:RNA-directed DNA polymerase